MWGINAFSCFAGFLVTILRFYFEKSLLWQWSGWLKLLNPITCLQSLFVLEVWIWVASDLLLVTHLLILWLLFQSEILRGCWTRRQAATNVAWVYDFLPETLFLVGADRGIQRLFSATKSTVVVVSLGSVFFFQVARVQTHAGSEHVCFFAHVGAYYNQAVAELAWVVKVH